MVRGEICRRQRLGTEILQPELCHSGPVYPAGAAGKPAYPFGGGRELGGEADRSGAGCWSRETGKAGPLVCGITSMYTGLDGLATIVRCHLKHDPCDGSVYVFRDSTGTMLKYIEWDGRRFVRGKRRAQSGSYPWPKGESGTIVEISEREFAYLLSKSIVPFKEKTRHKRVVMIEITALLLYNNRMEKEKKSTAEWRALLAKKEEEITALQRQVDWLSQQLRLTQGQRFGASSEQTQVLSEQFSLFNEAETVASPEAAEPDLDQITYKRKKRKGKRETDFSGLPTEQVIHEPPEEERICLECGGPLHACGHTALRRELTYIPAQYKVVEHVQTVYSCRHCKRMNDHVPMKKSAVPPALLSGSGVVSPGLLAHILNNKYMLALPLYRQEQEFQRAGVPISRQTMANWILAAHERWFSDFFQLLRRELLTNKILHANETTLMVLQEPGRKARQKSYMWVYRTSGDSERPVVLYDYQPTGRASAPAVS